MNKETQNIEFKSCKNEGYPEPEFNYDGGGLWTVFYFGEKYKEDISDTIQKTTQKVTKTNNHVKKTDSK